MKKLFLLFPLLAALGYITLSSYSTGYAAGGGGNATGATGGSGCSCHTSATTTTVALELDSAGISVSHYIAGHSYTVKITGTNTSTTSLPRFGFQVSVVGATGAGTASATNAGTLASTGLPASCQNVSAGTTTVVEQSSAIVATSGTGGSGTTYVESIGWTAPTTAGTGSIKIYGVVNAVNYTGGSGGDKWNRGNITITELIPVTVTVGAITGTTTVCAGSTTTLADTSAGGTWTSGTPGVATITSAGVVTGVTPGTSIITYTAPAGTATATVTVATSPGTITGTPSVCVGSVVTLADGPTGGVWSSTSTGIATVGTTGAVTGLSGGTDTIKYAIGSCVAAMPFTVNPLPNAGSITGASSVCIGTPITLSDAAGGGTWSSGSPGVASVTTGGVVSGATVGTAIISYQVTNSCGTATATHTVSVGTPPVVGAISGPTSVCAGSTITLSEATGGGTWSSSAPGTASVSGGVVTGVVAGPATISYTVSGSCGAASAIYNITVNPLPNAGTISGPSTICLGTPITLTDAAGGGTWSSSAGGVANVTGGVVNGVTTGTATISYTVTNVCGTVYATQPVTVYPSPSAGTITGPSGVCEGATITLTDGTGSGTWSSGTPGVATVNSSGAVSGVSGGTAHITYTIMSACGAASTSYNVTVTPPPTVAGISGYISVCQGATITLSDATPGGTWSSGTPGYASVNSSGVVSGLAGGAATIDYSVTGACGTTTVTYGITVNGIPAPATIVGMPGMCAGSTLTLFDATGGGTWSSSSPSVASVGSSGIVNGLTVGTTNITYTVTNACGTGYSVHAMSVATPPTVSPIITGSSSECAGVSTISMTDGTPGGAWSSSNTSVATVTGGTVTGITGGSAIISYSVSNACSTATATSPVAISAAPVAGTITGPADICIGATATLADGAATGVFSSNDTSIASIDISGDVTGVSLGTTVITYTVTNGCGTATTTFPIAVSVPPSAGTISGGSSVCAGDNLILSESVSGGTWSSSASGVASVSSIGLITAVSAGTSTISYGVAGCETVYATNVITVLPQPDAGAISGAARVCIGTPLTLSETATGGTWSCIPTTVATISATGVVTGIAPGIANIFYSVTNSCGTQSASFADTVLTAAECTAGVNNVEENQFKVYPNPSNGSFTIQLPTASGDALITVVDIMGNTVLTNTAHGNSAINVEHIAAGNYMITVQAEGQLYHAKITVW